MAANNPPYWVSLHQDLILSIAKHISSLEDYVFLRSVCRSWRSAATKENFNSSNLQLPPWLMFRQRNPNSSITTTKIYSLTNHKTYQILHGQSYARTIFSSMGWILDASSPNQFGRLPLKLVHPLKPDRPYPIPYRDINFVSKFLLSSRPSLSFDFMALVIYKPSPNNDSNRLSFWKPGMSLWTTINAHEPVFFVDVVSFNGRFYAVDRRRRVLALNLDQDHNNNNNNNQTVSVVSELNLPKSEAPFVNPYDVEKLYLVESDGSLLVVQGNRQWLGHAKSETTEFRVFEVNVNDGSFGKVKSLGDRALFLGDNSSSFSIKASDFKGCKSNCIYFADDFRSLGNNGVRSEDVGIFHMQDRKLERFFQFEDRNLQFLAPLWVQPSFYI